MTIATSASVQNPYHRANSLEELLSWQDVDFVRCAFVTLLGRQPDAEGEASFTSEVRRGSSKYRLIWALRTSDEGQQHDPGIAGLDRTLRWYRLARFPLIGPLLSPRFAKEYSLSERQTRLLESRIAQFAREQLGAVGYLDNALAELRGGIAEVRQLAAQPRAEAIRRVEEAASHVAGLPGVPDQPNAAAMRSQFGWGTQLAIAPEWQPSQPVAAQERKSADVILNKVKQELSHHAA